MPYEFYKVLHLIGIMLLFLSLGAALYSGFQGQVPDKKTKRPWMIMHGVAMVLILVAGFGLLARLGMVKGFPGWIWVKLGLWAFYGGAVAAVFKKPSLAKAGWLIFIVLGGLAAYLAGYKPF